MKCRTFTHSSIFSPSFPTLRAAESSIGRVRSILRDSIHTLSVRISLVNQYRLPVPNLCYALRQIRRSHLSTSLLKLAQRLSDPGGNGRSKWLHPRRASGNFWMHRWRRKVWVTILLIVKYGQTPLSRPYCRTSARVHIPEGIKFPGSIFPKFWGCVNRCGIVHALSYFMPIA